MAMAVSGALRRSSTVCRVGSFLVQLASLLMVELSSGSSVQGPRSVRLPRVANLDRSGMSTGGTGGRALVHIPTSCTAEHVGCAARPVRCGRGSSTLFFVDGASLNPKAPWDAMACVQPLPGERGSRVPVQPRFNASLNISLDLEPNSRRCRRMLSRLDGHLNVSTSSLTARRIKDMLMLAAMATVSGSLEVSAGSRNVVCAGSSSSSSSSNNGSSSSSNISRRSTRMDTHLKIVVGQVWLATLPWGTWVRRGRSASIRQPQRLPALGGSLTSSPRQVSSPSSIHRSRAKFAPRDPSLSGRTSTSYKTKVPLVARSSNGSATWSRLNDGPERLVGKRRASCGWRYSPRPGRTRGGVRRWRKRSRAWPTSGKKRDDAARALQEAEAAVEVLRKQADYGERRYMWLAAQQAAEARPREESKAVLDALGALRQLGDLVPHEARGPLEVAARVLSQFCLSGLEGEALEAAGLFPSSDAEFSEDEGFYVDDEAEVGGALGEWVQAKEEQLAIKGERKKALMDSVAAGSESVDSIVKRYATRTKAAAERRTRARAALDSARAAARRRLARQEQQQTEGQDNTEDDLIPCPPPAKWRRGGADVDSVASEGTVDETPVIAVPRPAPAAGASASVEPTSPHQHQQQPWQQPQQRTQQQEQQQQAWATRALEAIATAATARQPIATPGGDAANARVAATLSSPCTGVGAHSVPELLADGACGIVMAARAAESAAVEDRRAEVDRGRRGRDSPAAARWRHVRSSSHEVLASDDRSKTPKRAPRRQQSDMRQD